MSGPLVSVVVPTLNRASLLPRVLSTVLAQELPDPASLEVVVVDDGCSDGTPQALRSWPDPRLRVVTHDRPRGVSRARNDGTRAARGQWVAWCDDDDLWAPDKLRRQLEALAETPGARWCNGGAVNVDSDLQLLGSQPAPPSGDLGRTLLSRNLVTGGGSGVLAERRLVLELGGFDEELSTYADWHMWARLGLAAPVATVDAPLVAYVDHPGAMSHSRARLYAELETLRRRLGELAAREGLDTGIDDEFLTWWMLRQQVRAGRRLDAALVRLHLLRLRAARPSHLVRASLAGMALPSLQRRRWEIRERDGVDPAYAEAAERWLAPRRLAPGPLESVR